MVYYYCPCCGMALLTSPTKIRDKGGMRQIQPRREEQDRIMRLIKGNNAEFISSLPDEMTQPT
jgi:hypothetical protein